MTFWVGPRRMPSRIPPERAHLFSLRLFGTRSGVRFKDFVTEMGRASGS